jgi:hypothetical protein
MTLNTSLCKACHNDVMTRVVCRRRFSLTRFYNIFFFSRGMRISTVSTSVMSTQCTISVNSDHEPSMWRLVNSSFTDFFIEIQPCFYMFKFF